MTATDVTVLELLLRLSCFVIFSQFCQRCYSTNETRFFIEMGTLKFL